MILVMHDTSWECSLQYEAFFKKKQLLAQRDDLLEEIGQELFDSGELPSAFATLPKEFQTFDILVRQLKERYRSLKEERDRSVLHLHDYTEEKNRAEKEIMRELKPARQDCDELMLKERFNKDMKKPDEACKEISDRLNEALDHVETLEARLARNQMSCNEKIHPLKEHIISLERTIRDVLDEEERLSYERKKRLRDLGYHFRSCPPNKESLASKYAKMKLLRIELAEFQHSEKRDRGDRQEEPEVIKKSGLGEGWLVPILILVAAVVLGYFFRTKFEEHDIDFADIAAHYLTDEVTDSLYVDLSQIPVSRVSSLLPRLTSLPGGEISFTSLDSEDLVDLLVAHKEGELLYCGLRFRTAPARFSLRLHQKGWDYQTSILSRKVLKKDNWVWLQLNEKAFLLVPADKAQKLEQLPMVNYSQALAFRGSIQPFDNNHALLQGFDRLDIQVDQNRFEVQLTATAPLVDLAEREDLLKSSLARKDLSVSFKNQELDIAGSADLLPDTFDLVELQAMIANQVRPIMRKKDRIQLNETVNLEPGTETERLLLFETSYGEPKDVAHLPLDGGVVESHFQEATKGLLVLTEANLKRYRINKSRLEYDCSAEFAEAEVGDNGNGARGFEASQMIVTPDSTFAVILENERRGVFRSQRPRFLLTDLNDVVITGVETLAGNATACLNGTWDASGETLYLGVRPRQRRGQSRQAVVIYQRQGQDLSFQRILELPNSNERFNITDLWQDSYRDHLYLSLWPQERVVRFDLKQDSDAQLLSLRQSLSKETNATMPRGGMVSNRTGDGLLMVGSQPNSVDGRHELNLIDVSEGKMALIDTLDPGIRISRIWRQPLSDQFWVLSEMDEQILLVQIVDGHLEGKALLPLSGMRPAHIKSDPLGRHVFVIGSPVE